MIYGTGLIKNVIFRSDLDYLDSNTCINYEVYRAVTLEIMGKFLAKIKMVVKLNFVKSVTQGLGLIQPLFLRYFL